VAGGHIRRRLPRDRFFGAAAARRAGVGRALLEEFTAAAREHGLEWVFAVPDEAPGVAGRVAWLSESGFAPVADPGELWPVMGRWIEPGR
jgi:N-acetylglutamate synthase-like GNAT family acetyltransferase